MMDCYVEIILKALMLQRTICALNLYHYSFESLEITNQHKFSVVDFKGINFHSTIKSVSYDIFECL